MLKLPSPFKTSPNSKKSAHRIDSVEVECDVTEEPPPVAHQSSVNPPEPKLPAIQISTVKSTSTSQSMKSHGRGFPSLFSSIRRARGSVFGKKGRAKKGNSQRCNEDVQEISFKARNSSSIKIKAAVDSGACLERQGSEKRGKYLGRSQGGARKKSFTETIAATISFLKGSTTGGRTGSVKRS